MTDRVLAQIRDIGQSFTRMGAAPSLNALVLSSQKRLFCSWEPRTTHHRGITFDVLPDVSQVLTAERRYDLCILCCHNEGEEVLLLRLRQRAMAGLYFVWLWDNHHNQINNLRISMLGDVVFVSHWHERDYLNQLPALAGCHMPAYSRQWSPDAMDHFFPMGLPLARKDGLFGGFGRYDFTPHRTAFIEACMAFPDAALSLVDIEAYFRRPPAERLQGWIDHKVHLLAPVNDDVSTRLFEALICGQIPLVPHNVPDLDRVISPQDQAALPVLRYQSLSADSARQAWRDGVARFDAEGAEGVARRHAFARSRHSLEARLEAFAHFLRGGHHFDLTTRNGQLNWRHWQ